MAARSWTRGPPPQLPVTAAVQLSAGPHTPSPGESLLVPQGSRATAQGKSLQWLPPQAGGPSDCPSQPPGIGALSLPFLFPEQIFPGYSATVGCVLYLALTQDGGLLLAGARNRQAP